ncbi:MAG: sulfite oxidase-like oxidoreductase [Proteobacteria bacterium]|nr:sulfite oxidase-like oxidoreductase [Pseudomonadota bacterium]
MTQPAGMKEKLIATKERWATEGRGLTGAVRSAADRLPPNRLPPGQRLVSNWPVLDLGVTPTVAPDRWALEIAGLVRRPARFDLTAFQALPLSTMRSDIHCVTSWSRYDNDWQGVSAKDLLADVEPLKSARFVLFESYDGYTTNLPLGSFAAEDVLLATHWQGAPLAAEHGGPMRVVVPKHYFWKSAKWVNRIVFAAEDKPGFWEMRGYHNFADPWAEERYS